jgi:hypothetical protein
MHTCIAYPVDAVCGGINLQTFGCRLLSGPTWIGQSCRYCTLGSLLLVAALHALVAERRLTALRRVTSAFFRTGKVPTCFKEFFFFLFISHYLFSEGS